MLMSERLLSLVGLAFTEIGRKAPPFGAGDISEN
jgi:hypothetical protein